MANTMSRDELTSLGMTDEELCALYEKHFKVRPTLDPDADTDDTQRARRAFFNEVTTREGGSVHTDPDLPKIRSFALDLPDDH